MQLHLCIMDVPTWGRGGKCISLKGYPKPGLRQTQLGNPIVFHLTQIKAPYAQCSKQTASHFMNCCTQYLRNSSCVTKSKAVD